MESNNSKNNSNNCNDKLVMNCERGADIDWGRFVLLVKSSRRALLTAHRRPDGDCLGSELGMYHILTQLGKEVRILNHHSLPPTLSFLDPLGLTTGLKQMTDEFREWIKGVDLIMILDTSVWSQLGDMGQIIRESGAVKVVLDHHESWDDLGAERFVDAEAEATGALVVCAAEALGVGLSYDVAFSVFVALVTDTGWLSYASANAGTFRTAAKLIDAGVIPAEIYREIYEQDSLGRLHLTGRTFANVESFFDGKLVFAKVMLEDLKITGALSSETEGFASMILRVKNSQVSILITELDDGSFKLSFRSRNEIDCNKIAKLFAGGGHKRAAGATVNLPFDEIKKQAINAVKNAIESL
ncbi:MAG: bifunctional oligoribonuclease/PAP phosphatase NrnA [Planctomycetaceae bacterium]|jgi:phosphoesterase RecJ-like protein|nr:bifunctional oligoribonuclease/PAP phosphatase NrnA [Planctomycetaceae bacterium]